MKVSRFAPSCVCALLLALVRLVEAHVFPSQQGQVTFRAGIDLVQVSIQVHDRDHHPVRGLTAGDFDVRVDDATETIAAFSELDAPLTAPDTGANWTRDAAPDVATNDGADRESRLWTVIMDDCSIKDAALAVPFMVPNAKAVANALVDRMAPADRAAIVFSFNSRNAQDFTSSRSKLRAAIDTFTPAPTSARCRPHDTIRSVATFLQELANPRAAIVYVGLPPTFGADAAAPKIPLLTRTRFYGFDVAAVVAGPASADVRDTVAMEQMFLARFSQARQGFLQTLAEMFGGIAIPETNEPVREISRMFADLSVTYVLGYQPTYPLGDGRYRRLRVRVKRPGLTVDPSDRMFKTEKAVDPSKPIAPWVTLTNALSGILPDADAPLQVNLLPIAATGGNKGQPNIAVVLGARVPAGAASTKRSLDILSMVFDSDGRRVSSQQSRAEVPGLADGADLRFPLAAAAQTRSVQPALRASRCNRRRRRQRLYGRHGAGFCERAAFTLRARHQRDAGPGGRAKGRRRARAASRADEQARVHDERSRDRVLANLPGRQERRHVRQSSRPD